jgi:hypothetical protein
LDRRESGSTDASHSSGETQLRDSFGQAALYHAVMAGIVCAEAAGGASAVGQIVRCSPTGVNAKKEQLVTALHFAATHVLLNGRPDARQGRC